MVDPRVVEKPRDDEKTEKLSEKFAGIFPASVVTRSMKAKQEAIKNSQPVCDIEKRHIEPLVFMYVCVSVCFYDDILKLYIISSCSYIIE